MSRGRQALECAHEGAARSCGRGAHLRERGRTGRGANRADRRQVIGVGRIRVGLIVGLGILVAIVFLALNALQTRSVAPLPPSTLGLPAAEPEADGVRRIAPAEAKVLLDHGQAALYDTRSAEAYQAEHASGAVSFPDSEIEARLGMLPTGKVLIFY